MNYDPNTGLFKGETSGLDHRSKTYPDWMDEGYFSGHHGVEGKRNEHRIRGGV